MDAQARLFGSLPAGIKIRFKKTADRDQKNSRPAVFYQLKTFASTVSSVLLSSRDFFKGTTGTVKTGGGIVKHQNPVFLFSPIRRCKVCPIACISYILAILTRSASRIKPPHIKFFPAQASEIYLFRTTGRQVDHSKTAVFIHTCLAMIIKAAPPRSAGCVRSYPGRERRPQRALNLSDL